MKKYYEYVRVRNSRGKLTVAQFRKCKEGNIKGVFGYPRKIEELAKEKGTRKRDMDAIISRYESFENFVEAYRKGQLAGEDLKLASSLFKNVLDIDFDPHSRNYDMLYRAIFEMALGRPRVELYSSKNLKLAVQTLNSQEQQVITERYGIITGEGMKSLEEIGKKLKVSRERVRQVEAKAFRGLRHPKRQRTFCYYAEGMEERFVIPEEEGNGLCKLIDNLYVGNCLLENQTVSVLGNDREIIEILQGIELVRNFHSAVLEGRIQRKEPEIVPPIKEEYVPQVNPEEVNEDNEALGEAERNRIEQLEKAKRTRAELQAEVERLEGKMAVAKALIEAYDRVLGEEAEK